MQRAVQIQLDLAAGEVFDDVARVGQRAREPVKLRDDDRVAGAAVGERFAEPRAAPGGPVSP